MSDFNWYVIKLTEQVYTPSLSIMTQHFNCSFFPRLYSLSVFQYVFTFVVFYFLLSALMIIYTIVILLRTYFITMLKKREKSFCLRFVFITQLRMLRKAEIKLNFSCNYDSKQLSFFNIKSFKGFSVLKHFCCTISWLYSVFQGF